MIFSRFSDNFRYKLLALLCAIALRWYVANQQDQRQTRSLVVTLAAQSIPDGYVLLDKNVPISVVVEGPTDALNRLPDDGVTATVDMTHAKGGRDNILPVHASVTAPGVRDIVMISDIRPQTVSLMLQQQRRRRLTLSVAPAGSPAAGYTIARADTIPGDATVIGGSDVVDNVARIVVRPHAAGATGPVEEDDPIIAVDTHGNDVADVTISPDTAHVRVVIAESAREREAFVTPTLTGNLAPGFRVLSVDVVPSTAALGGSPLALNAAKNIATDPIDLSGQSADIARTVHCIAPQGTTMSRPVDVAVTIHVGPIDQAAMPPAVPQQPPATPPNGAPPSPNPGEQHP